jgi:hypothetical protein
MLHFSHPLALSLLFCLFAMAFASPASAWRIAAGLQREGIGTSGPSDLEETFSGPGDKRVSVSQSDGYPDNSEIGGQASVDLATGAMRGSAHAVAVNINSEHKITFGSTLREDVSIIFPSALPLADRIVQLRASVSAGFAATNVAIADGIFVVDLNNRRGSVEFGTNVDDEWHVLSQGAGVTTMRTAGGQQFLFTLPNGTSTLSIEAQLSGTARAFGDIMKGTGLADVNAQNTAFFELLLPAGATFTSGSGVFLTQPIPEPGTAALMLLGAGILAARGRRARSLA